MVVVAAIVIDVVVVGVAWWAIVAWVRRRKAAAQFQRQVGGVASDTDVTVTQSDDAEAPDQVIDVRDRPPTDRESEDVGLVSASAATRTLAAARTVAATRSVSTARTVSAAGPPASAPQAAPPAAGPTPPAVSDLLLARLSALRDGPGAAVANEINNSEPDAATS